MSTFCLNNCCNSPWHAFYKSLAYLWRYFIPLLSHSLPQLIYSFRWNFIFLKFAFDVEPEVFNGIEVRGLGRLMNNNNVVVFKPSCGQFGGVFWIIVLLEDSFILIHLQLLKAFHQPLLQYFTKLSGIHLPLHLH